jgi:small-conductance mechanosensitive channel
MMTHLHSLYLVNMALMIIIFFCFIVIRLSLKKFFHKIPLKKNIFWKKNVAHLVIKTQTFFLLSLSVFLSTKFKPLPWSNSAFFKRTFFVIFMWQFFLWSRSLIVSWLWQSLAQRSKNNPAVMNSVSLIEFSVQVLLLLLVALFTLSQMDIQITSLVAGLGIGGIAMALAIQKILGDLFASLSIILDKPFTVGDFITIDTFYGEVQKIGLKSTRLRSQSGEEIVFSNSDLLSARIRNFKKIQGHRMNLNLEYSTTLSDGQISMLMKQIKDLIESNGELKFESCHLVKISQNLEFQAIYWNLSTDSASQLSVQQKLLLGLRNLAPHLEQGPKAYLTHSLPHF